jgi:hypothetical protein
VIGKKDLRHMEFYPSHIPRGPSYWLPHDSLFRPVTPTATPSNPSPPYPKALTLKTATKMFDETLGIVRRCTYSRGPNIYKCGLYCVTEQQK